MTFVGANFSEDLFSTLKNRLDVLDGRLSAEGIILDHGFRYMHDVIEDRTDAIESRILEFTKNLKETMVGFEPSSQSLFACQESITIVGRILSETEDQKLTESTVFLESSATYGRGEKIRLDLRNIPDVSLFPGQVVAVVGQNPSGFCLVATQIIDFLAAPTWQEMKSRNVPEDGAPKKLRISSAGVMEVDGSEPSGDTLHLVVACGPFCTTESLKFEPLTSLLAQVKSRSPDVLILMGPFLNPDHPQVKNATLEVTFQELFEESVLLPLLSFCKEWAHKLTVVLVPSVKDPHHHFVFPQPPFSSPTPDLSANKVLTLGNPGCFSFKGLGFCMSTADIAMHLSRWELRKASPASSADRMSQLASHVIGQRCFYPLFPPDRSLPLDLSHLGPSLNLPFTPDVLLLPSDLNPFVKVIGGRAESEGGGSSTLCVNPGRVLKGLSGGTFADIQALLPPLSDGQPLRVGDSTRVEIVKM